jgi:hypothetical protein
MAERTLGGAPSSRVKGTAGGGGGVKGPHSDSSTSSLEGQKKRGGTPTCGLGHIRKLMQFHLSLLGVSRVTRTRRKTGGESGNV